MNLALALELAATPAAPWLLVPEDVIGLTRYLCAHAAGTTLRVVGYLAITRKTWGMTVLVAFDMFGTLADTASVARELASCCGDMADGVARTWRDKQLEYMFRVTAMGQFPSFADLTRWGLARALAEFGIALDPAQQDVMAGAYRRLRPFDDALPALAALRERGHSIVVFSVGPRAWLEELAVSYRDFVDDFVSAEDVGVYKPHPGIYRHLLAQAGTEPPAALLVSCNSFDVVGAGAVGMRTAWCKRQPDALFDPWGSRPDYVISSLSELADILSAR